MISIISGIATTNTIDKVRLMFAAKINAATIITKFLTSILMHMTYSI